eukprot:444079-Rhodomonas_salina.3
MEVALPVQNIVLRLCSGMSVAERGHTEATRRTVCGPWYCQRLCCYQKTVIAGRCAVLTKALLLPGGVGGNAGGSGSWRRDHESHGISLCRSYAISGTDMPYLCLPYATPGTDLRVWYAMPGAEIRCGATSAR